MKRKILIVLGIIILISIGIISNVIKNKDNNVIINDANVTNFPKKIICEIKGEVVRPGVYTLNKGDRLSDLIEAAGGFTVYADTSSVSIVSVLEDSRCYVISRKIISNNNDDDNLININTASKEELMTLNGIGEAKAQAIIDYRNKNGKFNSIEDLLNVSGISEKILNQNIDLICAK